MGQTFCKKRVAAESVNVTAKPEPPKAFAAAERPRPKVHEIGASTAIQMAGSCFGGCSGLFSSTDLKEMAHLHHVPKRHKDDYPEAGDHHHGEVHGLRMSINSGNKKHDPHWGYIPDTPNGPTRWGCLCKAYSAAAEGKEQSPIDLFDPVCLKADHTLHNLQLKYTPCAGMLENNGHSCQLNFKNAGSAVIEGNTYELKQVHFHAPSEHTVNGKLFPMEMHMVHADGDGNLAVIGLLFEFGNANPFLQTFWDELTDEVGKKKELTGPFDMNMLGLEKANYYRYQGSLTTPPCTEKVNWTMMHHAFQASPAQVQKFREVMDFKYQRRGNNRPIQPLNDRVLQTYKMGSWV